MPARLSQEEFIKRSVIKHKGRYSYANVKYVNNYTKVSITCNIHGDWLQAPSAHLKGVGCKPCMYKQSCVPNFLDKAKKVHGTKYDYSKTVYIKSSLPVTIKCKEHGIFTQLPAPHLRGMGCRKCAIKTITLSTSEYIKRCKKQHGNKYDYSKVEYVHSLKPVIIICKKHGEFKQLASVHVSGCGCSLCGKGSPFTKKSFCSGVNKAYLYILHIKEENIIKIGITKRSVTARYATNKLLPYKYETVLVKEGCCRCIWKVEKRLEKEFKKYKKLPTISFQGRTECYSDKIIKKVLKFIA